MSNFGIKIAKQGKDVKKATDRDLIFSSRWGTHKVCETGTITVTVPANQTTEQITTVNHSLFYVPTAEMWVLPTGSSSWYCTPDTNGCPDFAWAPMFDWSITSTQVSALVQHQAGVASDKTYTFKYILFVERLK